MNHSELKQIKTELNPMIDDKVRQSTDSTTRALTEVIRSLQLDSKDSKEKLDTFIEEMSKHIKRVEPVILSWEENQIFLSELKKRGGWIIYIASAVAVISTAWFVIKNWLIALR